MSAPKLFISYSWTTQDHEAWVLTLAKELRESGIDVILDKWDLKEGHDALVFMESMVSDPTIGKVILICDKAYADKTDGRSGGVGTEAQIISAEIYQKQDQDKFVAVVVERDEEGRAYLPVYYRARIYVDLSDPSTYSANFERLIRWVFDKPLDLKPELGEPPSYLSGDGKIVTLATSSRFKRAFDALKTDKSYTVPAVIEYLELVVAQFEGFRLPTDADPFDDAVVQSIESFTPYRNELVELFLAMALYQDSQELRQALHRFFEQLIPYLDQPEHIKQWHEWDFDNFRFIIRELFLYAVACFIRHQRFESASHLLGTDYYVAGRSDYGENVMVPFSVFWQPLRSFSHRNQRLGLQRLSLSANLLQQRCKGLSIEFRDLMQADFVLFMRASLDEKEDSEHWRPDTLVYAERFAGPFEIFARSRSANYFDRIKVLLGIDAKKELQTLLEAFDSNERRIPRWEFSSFSPVQFLGFPDIATRP